MMIDFNNKSIIDFLNKDPELTKFQPYEYRGKKGYAKLMGWEIVIFSPDKKSITAINLAFNSEYEQVNKKSEEIGNSLIECFNQKMLPENLNKCNKPIKVEESIMSDAIDYYYNFDDSLLIVGVLDDKIQTFEYSRDPDINKSILDFIEY